MVFTQALHISKDSVKTEIRGSSLCVTLLLSVGCSPSSTIKSPKAIMAPQLRMIPKL